MNNRRYTSGACWLVFALLAGLHSGRAQDSTGVLVPTEAALLWEISGQGLKAPSHLFGTIHIIPKDSFFLPPATLRHLDAAARLVLELPMDLDLSTMLASARAMMLPGKQEIGVLLDTADYAYLRSFMADSMPAKVPMYERMKPLMTTQQIATTYCIDGKTESYELYFTRRAQKQKKPVSGLETFEEQLAMLDAIPLEEQAEGLMKTVRNMPEVCGGLRELVQVYRQQDLDALVAMTTEDEDMAGHMTILLDDRNQRWIAQIEELMRREQVFIAVGAGHLGGEAGVIALLRARGYTLTPLYE
ncbi:MAG: TraB/GumN family protein [Bacteroidia bacterium]